MRPLLVLLSASLLLFIGCDRKPATYPVQGTVRFSDGKALHAGNIELRSRSTNVFSRGTIDPNGHFTLSTYSKDDGAVAGEHDCVISQTVIVEDIPGFVPSMYGVLDSNYADYKTSNLKVVIEHTNLNKIELIVERRQPRAEHNEEDHRPIQSRLDRHAK